MNIIAVGTKLKDDQHFEESIQEFFNLCEACELKIVSTLTQNIKSINPAYYLGTGKIYELKQLVHSHEVKTIVFNNELSPAQVNNIENALECEIIDRTRLILQIFSKRAKTKEAKLQVEIAKLKYELPRIIETDEDFGRQSGGVGTKNRGAGETKLELRRRKIEEKIALLNKQLETMVIQRQTQRNKRYKKDIPTVALVGYTNAGKSSLMNELVRQFHQDVTKEVFEKNMLFATLDTYVRTIDIQQNKSFLLSDTVGFVSNLPHELVKAFRSTLEEVCEADLLLHIIDISNENYNRHIEVTQQTLSHIHALDIPTIKVYNKIDLMDESVNVDDGVMISSKKSIGIEKLIATIKDVIFNNFENYVLCVPYTEGKVMAFINENLVLNEVTYEDFGIVYKVECSQMYYSRIEKYIR